MRITALMDISQKVNQQLDLDEEKRTKQNQNEAKQNKTPKKTQRETHKETCSSRSDGLQPKVRITLLRERESSFMKMRILFLHENHCKYIKKKLSNG